MRRLLVPLLLVTLLTGCAQFGKPNIGEFRPSVNASRVELYNQFGFDLFGRLENNENRLISPVSIAIALSMAYNGADGNTKAEMAQALLAHGIDLETFNRENQALLSQLQNSDVTVDIANSVWLRKGLAVKPDFVSNNQTYYDAAVSELDFSQSGAVDAINGWVNQNTKGLIEEIVQNPIDPMTLMFLINAVYFQGDWANEFDKALTQDDSFKTPGGTVTVPFMNKGGRFHYLENKDFQAIRLPYGEGRLAMYVFLPKNLSSFENQLSYENWTEWLSGFASSQGHLSIPKFEMEYEATLNEVLQAMGMKDAFDPNKANFQQMVDESAVIDQVKHKTFIKVDEEGTEAAAVTSIGVVTTSIQPIKTFEMKVDRPFFFAIHDSEADTILFMGSVLDPR